MAERSGDDGADAVGDGGGLERLLEHLKRTRAFDFTGYKRATLRRRVDRRMEAIGITSYDDYVDHLEVRPDELTELFNTILINVTSFFRDPEAWDHLRDEVLVPLAEARREGPIRVWSAGCASGPEAYSIAILLAELLGIDRYCEQVKIYATDVDDDALEQARSGRYTAKELEGLPEALRDRYLSPVAGGHVVDRDLRRSVIFGHHDLIQDAPISRIDVLVCRNTLMYFNAETQAGVVSRMHFALADTGALFLGKVEMLLGHTALFRPISSAHRVFVKMSPSSISGLAAMAQHSAVQPAVAERSHLLDLGFELGRSAGVVVDGAGVVVAANQAAREMLALEAAVVGRPLHDLTVSYRPVELRSLITAASSTRETVHVGDVEWRNDRDQVVGVVDVDVVPLEDGVDGRSPVLVTFSDVSGFRALRDDLERANRQLETAYEELQSSNEELETTNEELQSTVEELETTNEELQSTNEELSSINVELQAINDELRIRTEEVNEVNAFMESILMSLRGGVAVLDRTLTVQVWNGHAEELWGLRAVEAEHRPFLALDIGLPVGELREPLLAFLDGEQVPRTVELDAVNRRSQRIRCQVSTSALLGSSGETEGVIVLMEELPLPAGGSGDPPRGG